MPSLSLAHFILTLWLFAAVAPAASVLLHSALGVLVPERAETLASSRTEALPRTTRARGRTPATRPAPKDPASGAAFAKQAAPRIAPADVSPDIATPSVLHTGVQRHRPRLG